MRQIAGGKAGERERLREGKRRVDVREGERESVCVSEKDKERSGTFSFHECLKL